MSNDTIERQMTWDEVVAEMVKFRDERDRLREVVNTALIHMIGYYNPTTDDRQVIVMLRKALMEANQ